eukprot:gene5655-7241_t
MKCWNVILIVSLSYVAYTSAIPQGCTLLGEAPSCTSLNRLQCANETDTVCGPCIHGFKSVNNNTGQCVAVSCGYPPHKPNASPSSTQELYYGDTVTYTCDHGTATETEQLEFKMTCSSNGILEAVSTITACSQVDFCASNPCGDQFCERAIDGSGYQCRCKHGLAGIPDEDGNGCFTPELTIVNGELHALAQDIVFDLPLKRPYASLREIVDALKIQENKTLQVETSLQIIEQEMDISFDQMEADIVAIKNKQFNKLSSDVALQFGNLSSQIDTVSSELNSEISTARQEENSNREEVNQLRTLLISLATNHKELDSDHDITSALAATLESEIVADRSRAVSVEESLSTALISSVASLVEKNEKLSQDIQDLQSQIDSFEDLPGRVLSLEAAISSLAQLATPTTCKALLNAYPGSASGFYHIRPLGFTRATSLQVYCDMETDGGGWTRTGHIDGSTTEIQTNSVNSMVDASKLKF